MEFKKQYSKEDAAELLDWIDNEKPKGRADLGEGIVVEDMEKFAYNMRSILKERYHNPAYAGQLEILFRAKEAFQKQAKETAGTE